MTHLRNLQLFRNSVFLFTTTINSVELLKGVVETNIANELEDGEPIVIRYKESAGSEVKALFGTCYVQGTEHKILWTGEDIDISIISGSQDSDYVKINVSTNPDGSLHYQIATDIKTQTIANATEGDDGLATALDVQQAINNITHPEYTIIKQETAETDYLATYQLIKDDEPVGAKINIPKDFLVKSGEVKTVTEDDEPYTGAKVGDKYIDFVINVKEGSATAEHIYIPVKDLVDVYTGSKSIEISDTNVVSVKVSSKNDNRLSISDEGLYVSPYTAGDGIDISNNDIISVKVNTTQGLDLNGTTGISVKLSEETGNIIEFKDGKLYAALGASVTISDLKVINNTASTSVYYTVSNEGLIVEGTSESSPKVTIPSNKKYILLATSDKNIYGAELPETSDTYVVNATCGLNATSGKYDISLGRNDNNTVSTSLPNAEVGITGDVLNTTSGGLLTKEVIDTIENYIDNYDCGTFTI